MFYIRDVYLKISKTSSAANVCQIPLLGESDIACTNYMGDWSLYINSITYLYTLLFVC